MSVQGSRCLEQSATDHGQVFLDGAWKERPRRGRGQKQHGQFPKTLLQLIQLGPRLKSGHGFVFVTPAVLDPHLWMSRTDATAFPGVLRYYLRVSCPSNLHQILTRSLSLKLLSLPPGSKILNISHFSIHSSVPPPTSGSAKTGKGQNLPT